MGASTFSHADDGPKIRMGNTPSMVNQELNAREQVLSVELRKQGETKDAAEIQKHQQVIDELRADIDVLVKAQRAYEQRQKPNLSYRMSIKKMPDYVIAREIHIRGMAHATASDNYYKSSNPKIHQDEMYKLTEEIVLLRNEQDARKAAALAKTKKSQSTPTYGPDDPAPGNSAPVGR
ncbi:MAG: hypothetical protein ACXWPM_04260 [Bdellovibrionota bacterium]